jgi:diguanylate cyclase (GGDEF)-like protein
MPQSSPEPELFSLAQIQHLMRVEFGRAQRYEYPMGCMMIEIDRVAELRDVHGYEANDAVSKVVVAEIEKHTRDSDLLGRMPDGRFLLVLPHVPSQSAAVVGGRILEGVRGQTITLAGVELRVTLSLGAGWSDGGETLFFDALLECAGEALKAARAEGGDRMELRIPGASGG